MNAMPSTPNANRLALLLLFSTIFTACGGGPDPDEPPPAPVPAPAPAPAPASNARAAGSSFDYDANGVADAHDELSYDTQGRLVRRRYVYTGDGTPDRDALHGTQNETDENTYDTQGRLESSTTTRADGSSSHFALQYGSDGTLARMDITARAANGNVLAQQHELYSYTGGRMTESVLYQGGTALMRRTLSYDANGRPASADRVNPANPALFNTRTVYEWNTDGSLAVERYDMNRDGVDEEVTTFSHDAGRLVQTVRVMGGRYAGQPGVTYAFSYDGARLQRVDTDLGSNGGVDARHHASFESGVCRTIVFPMMVPLVTETGHQSSATGEVSYCAP